jgi:hypothetical protein
VNNEVATEAAAVEVIEEKEDMEETTVEADGEGLEGLDHSDQPQ